MRKCSSARRSQSRSRSASSSKSKIAAARRRRSSRESLGSSAKISDALTSNHINRGDMDFKSHSSVEAAILAARLNLGFLGYLLYEFFPCISLFCSGGLSEDPTDFSQKATKETKIFPSGQSRPSLPSFPSVYRLL